MGTPLPKIITLPGVECSICPETGSPFPDGPTPLNPVMTLSGWTEGPNWDEKFRKEIEAGAEMMQGANPCEYGAFTENLFWVWFNRPTFLDVRVVEIAAPNSIAFVALPAPNCQIQVSAQPTPPVGNIAFGGIAQLTWGDIV